MSSLPTSSPAGLPQGPLYSLVAWPPEALDTWLRRQQQRLNVCGFGVPHLNLRAPFQTSLPAPELIEAMRQAISDQPPFEVEISGWQRHSSVIFLACRPSRALLDLHQRVLDVQPTSRAPFDGPGYSPHLTLALGVLPWASDELWAAAQQLTPPTPSFRVSALSLTREERGEVQELHTFPLEKLPGLESVDRARGR